MRKEVLDNIFVDTNIIVGAFVGLEKEKKCLDYLFSPAINRTVIFKYCSVCSYVPAQKN